MGLQKTEYKNSPDIFNRNSPSLYSPTLIQRYFPCSTCLKWIILYRAGPSPLLLKWKRSPLNPVLGEIPAKSKIFLNKIRLTASIWRAYQNCNCSWNEKIGKQIKNHDSIFYFPHKIIFAINFNISSGRWLHFKNAYMLFFCPLKFQKFFTNSCAMCTIYIERTINSRILHVQSEREREKESEVFHCIFMTAP